MALGESDGRIFNKNGAIWVLKIKHAVYQALIAGFGLYSLDPNELRQVVSSACYK